VFWQQVTKKTLKKNGEGGGWGTSGVCKVMLSYFTLDSFLLWELGHPTRIMSGSSTLRGELGASHLWFVCMAPLRLGGLRGKKSTPSIGLGGTGEVSTISKKSEEDRHGARRIASRRRHQQANISYGNPV
jgi:hypothetical protein